MTDSEVDSCRRLLCHSLQRPHQPDHAGSHAGVQTRRPGQLDDPRKLVFLSIVLQTLCLSAPSAGGQQANISAIGVIQTQPYEIYNSRFFFINLDMFLLPIEKCT